MRLNRISQSADGSCFNDGNALKHVLYRQDSARALPAAASGWRGLASVMIARGDRFNLLPCSRLVTDNAREWPRGRYKPLG